ncbi:hypothetical protein SCB49_09425 [unidentified eubacterium SCB49]|nr:hypothetical protein SCB49_09425 [unidentified eubacterium SCB49]
MKNSICIAFFLIAIFSNAQEKIGNYSYIEVPDRFEFISGDNTYKMSDMMVFYFEKKGMSAYRKAKSPDVSKCNVLFADIEKSKSFLSTKLSVELRNCNDEVVFKSDYGMSKEKAYEKMYPDALRQAFATFTAGDVVRAEAKIIAPSSATEVTNVVQEKKDDLNVEVVTDAVNTTMKSVPEASFSNYQLNDSSYLLKKVESGFTFFLTQEGDNNFVKVGDISLKENGTFTMVDIYGEIKSGYFNSSQDLVVKLSSGAEVIYKKAL